MPSSDHHQSSDLVKNCNTHYLKGAKPWILLGASKSRAFRSVSSASLTPLHFWFYCWFTEIPTLLLSLVCLLNVFMFYLSVFDMGSATENKHRIKMASRAIVSISIEFVLLNLDMFKFQILYGGKEPCLILILHSHSA